MDSSSHSFCFLKQPFTIRVVRDANPGKKTNNGNNAKEGKGKKKKTRKNGRKYRKKGKEAGKGKKKKTRRGKKKTRKSNCGCKNFRNSTGGITDDCLMSAVKYTAFAFQFIGNLNRQSNR